MTEQLIENYTLVTGTYSITVSTLTLWCWLRSLPQSPIPYAIKSPMTPEYARMFVTLIEQHGTLATHNDLHQLVQITPLVR